MDKHNIKSSIVKYEIAIKNVFHLKNSNTCPQIDTLLPSQLIQKISRVT